MKKCHKPSRAEKPSAQAEKPSAQLGLITSALVNFIIQEIAQCHFLC
jgi:hypothetical protein